MDATGKEAVISMNSTDIRGIVLAGDHSWWESPLGGVLPRPLLPALQSPLISHVLMWFRRNAVSRATICANSSSGPVRSYLGNGGQLDMQLTYYDDRIPRGPAGCVRDAGAFAPAQHYVIAECTLIPGFDLSRALAFHVEARAAVTVVVRSDARGNGHGEHLAAPIGVYIFDAEVLPLIVETGYQDIKEKLVPTLRKSGLKVASYAAEEASPRVTGRGSYLALIEWLLDTVAEPAFAQAGYRKVGSSYVHESATIASGAQLVGPTLVGPYTRIERGVICVGPTTIGGNCTIGADAVVCRSTVWDDVKIERDVRIDESIVVNGARVPAGAAISGDVYAPARFSPIMYAGSVVQPKGTDSDPPLPAADQADPVGCDSRRRA